ncbi:MAG: three-Cys-motif partner protein TcmP [Pedobacter sp.]
MPKKEYEWEDGSIIEDHSLAKHEALREYLIRFVKALSPNPMQEKINLDIVDGFSGGGIYNTSSGNLHLGSPLIILESLKEAEAACTAYRKDMHKVKDFQVIGDKYFIDSCKYAIQSLNQTLDSYGYRSRIDQDIHVIQNTFHDALPILLKKLNQKRCKVIFLLDQYGYKDATLAHIKQIFSTLGNRAEVILTLSTDNIISYISEDPRYKTALKNAGIDHIITDEVIEQFRSAPGLNKKLERIAIQYTIASAYHKESGATWGNSLFIRSQKSNRAYLYLHLSNNFRAREEMNQVFWETSNEIVQDAGHGISMFEYDPENDIQSGFDFTFDDQSGSLTVEALQTELLDKFHSYNQEIISVQSFIQDAIQTATPAGLNHFQKALFDLSQYGELGIKTKDGGSRQKANSVKLTDKLIRPKQKVISFK